MISAKEYRLREYLDKLSPLEGIKFCNDWIVSLDSLASIGLDIYALKERILDGLDYVQRKPEISELPVYVETKPVCKPFLNINSLYPGTKFPQVPGEIAQKQFGLSKRKRKHRSGRKHRVCQ
jgi:hypothetical protein